MTRRASEPPGDEPEPPGDDDWCEPWTEPPVSQRRAPQSARREQPHRTDLGLAQHIEQEHRDDLRFCPELNAWLCVNGFRWDEGPDGAAIRLAKRTVGRLHREAKAALAAVADAPKAEQGEWLRIGREMLRFATDCERESRLRAGLSLAKTELVVRLEDLDRDPMLLAVGRVVVDLRTGQSRPGRRDDFITRGTNVEFDPDARCPTWERFLARVVPDAATRAFLQRAVGYSLSGDVSEHALFFLHGEGANGKSVFLRVLQWLLGDYAWAADDSLLLASATQSHPPGLAALHRKRVVVCNEIDEGRAWAEARLKALTGGDQLTARRMHENFWTFTPTHKLWLAANHRPRAKGTDHGLWRRIKLIPFGVQIPEAERDPALPERLRSELPGIMNWALAGCAAWFRDGLGEPPAIRDAVSRYRADQDVLGRWIRERCLLRPEARISRKAARTAYEAWCAEEGEQTVDAKTFAGRLRDLGLRDLGGPERYWGGLVLRDDVAEKDTKIPEKRQELQQPTPFLDSAKQLSYVGRIGEAVSSPVSRVFGRAGAVEPEDEGDRL